MNNSLLTLCAFGGFLLFGYFSVVRIGLKHLSNGKATLRILRWGVDRSLLASLGSSAFFVSLPATSLLLFWGWGPALLWLLVFHLLVESPLQLYYSSSQRSIADLLLRASNRFDQALEQGLIQSFLLLLMSVVTALLAKLVDTQSGLLFALLFLVPARKMLRNTSLAWHQSIKLIACAGLITFGVALSNKLGISIYGDWAPFGDMFGGAIAWLRFNNSTVIAAVLVVAIFTLDSNEGFKQDISRFAGAVIVLLTLAITVRLVMRDPVLDAPINISDASELPFFISICLLLFASLVAMLLRALNNDIDSGAKHASQRFAHIQSDSLISLLFALILVIALASAVGIGAWNTHYSNWSDTQSLLAHLNLGVASLVNLLHGGGQSNSLLNTILLASLCLTGFSVMLMCATQLSLEDTERERFYSVLIRTKTPQAVLVFVLSAYFIDRDIRIDVWLLIGVLAWVLVSHLVIAIALELNKKTQGEPMFSVFAMSLVALGLLQATWLAIYWALDELWVNTALVSLIVVIALRLWTRPLLTLIQAIRRPSKPNII